MTDTVLTSRLAEGLVDSGPTWNALYRLGGVAALLMAAIIVVHGAFVIVSAPPLDGAAAEWFRFFQQSSVLGLLGFEVLMVVYVIVSIPLALALVVALRRENLPLMLVYLALSLVGAVLFITARPAVEMLALGQAHAATTSDAERAALLAAGEVMVATFHGTAFYTSYVLGSLTGLLVSVVMLQSRVFGKTTAYIRIASSVLDFGLFLPSIGMFVSAFSVLFLFLWNLLIARRLFQLEREAIARECIDRAGASEL